MTLTSVLRGSAAASLLAAFVLSISPAFAADALVSVGDELAVGKNRTGEACRIKLVESRAEFGGLRRYHLFCDGWTQPSGEILSFGVGKGYTVEKILTDTGWAKNLERRLGGCGAKTRPSNPAHRTQAGPMGAGPGSRDYRAMD